MTHYLFHHSDLIAVGIILCVLLSLTVVLLAKILCRNKQVDKSTKGKEEKHPVYQPLKKDVPVEGTSFRELVTTPKDSSEYQEIFFIHAEITARTGKSVYIRKAHHDKIRQIVQVIGKNQVSLFSYIDNVLKHHLDTYHDEITELYNKNNKGIF